MAKNRFEQVDEPQDDAVTLSLWKQGEDAHGKVSIPASVSSGRLASDSVSGNLAVRDAFRSAIRIANEIRAAVVVMDPDGLWEAEWGDLYRPSES